MSMDGFYEQVRAAGTPRETKADAVEYYQQKYTGRGQAGWKQHLIHDLLGMQDITQASVGKDEYKRLVKNMSKRFDPQRLHSPEPRNADAYQALGELLPAIPPENGYHIYGEVWLKFSDGECEPRDIDEYVIGADAEMLALAAEEDLLAMVVNHYMDEDMDTEETNYSIGGCQPPDLQVEPIE